MFTNKKMRFAIIVLLVFMILMLAFAFNLQQAHASITLVSAATVGIIATFLVASGFDFENRTDLDTVATDFYNSATNEVRVGLDELASTYIGGEFLFNMTEGFLSSLSDYISDKFNFSNDSFIGDVSISTNDFFINGQSINWCPVVTSYDWYALSDAEKTALVVNSGVSLTSAYYPLSQMIVNSEGQSLYHDAFVKNDYGYIYGGCVVSPSFFLYSSGGSIYGSFGSGSNHYSFDKVLCVTFYNSLDVATSFRFVGYSSVDGYRGWIGADFDFGATTGFSTVVSSVSADSTFFPNADSPNALTTEIPLTVPADIDSLIGGTPDLVRDISQTVGGIEGTLNSLWDWIQSLPSAIAAAISSIFVPTDFTWDSFLDGVVDIITPPNSIDFRSYCDSIAIPDVTVNWHGDELTIVDNSMLRDNVETWRKYIGAFLSVLIAIFNFNMFLKLLGYSGLTITDSGRVGVNGQLLLTDSKGVK